MIQILLIDDQPPIRAGFGIILETGPSIEVAGKASSGTWGVELALELCPDVVCMDAQMPRINGIETTRELTSRECGSAVLVLTTFDRDDFPFGTLQAGTSGFLLKTAEVEKLIETVQTLGRDEGLLSPQVTCRIIKCFTAPRQELRCPGRVVAEMLAECKHDTLLHLTRGLNDAEIAAEMFVSPRTVRTHVSDTPTKLGLRDCTNAVIWAYENDLVPRSS